MYYRFSTGTFVQAESFEEARSKYIARIEEEVENEKQWHTCTCLGLSHRHSCPEAPHNKGEVPY